jgi:hypothetical protein
MRYDPASRIMTVSFPRDPEEHADVMLEAGKRFVASTNPGPAWMPFFILIGFGAIVGIVMELYRRLVLPGILHASEIVPLGVVLVQILPILLLAAGFYLILVVRLMASRRKTVISKLEPRLFIDADIYEEGISTSSSHISVQLDWIAVKSVAVNSNRIDVESEGYVIYFPERAFKNRAEFNEAAMTMRNLWREAKKAARDSKMAVAELG